MGTCLSKKKQRRSNEASPASSTQQTMVKKLEIVKEKVVDIAASNIVKKVVPAAVPAPAEEKKPQFVKSQNESCSITTAAATISCPEDKESTKRVETPKKKSFTSTKNDGEKSDGGGRRVAGVEEAPPATVRTSTCTKEEVDAILIQCGRLSRSSSGKAAETPTRKRYSGSKRSYDFDEATRGGAENEDCEKQLGSSCRRTPNRERSGDDDHHHHHHKRSGSRERGSGGSGNGARRTSRSPGRRSEMSDRSTKQPAKMVSVPAREKGNGISGDKTGAAAKRASSPTILRCQSPAHTRASNENSYPQSLSRSNSRKAEQSPHRRNPMAELDDNSLRPHKLHSKKANESNVQACKPPENRHTETSKNNNNNAINNCVREQLMSCRGKEQPEIVEEPATKPTIVRSRSSRRSSRDLDQILGLSNSMFLQENNTALSLPACVSKACSILEAVADLNSENKNHPPFLESEVIVKDDIMEPSIHKYVTVRGLAADLEPQESAGSNSFMIGGGQPWSSSWEPNSVESSERCWTSQSANATGEEEEQSSLHDLQKQSSQESRGRRMRGGAGSFSNNNSLPSGSATNGGRRKDVQRHRGGSTATGSGVRVGGRTATVATGGGGSS